jgi:hypothetical protein
MPAATTADLLPQHAALLDASAITPAVRAARGYRSVTRQSELERLGFARSQRSVPALLVPIYGPNGRPSTYQSRPDTPRVNGDGRPVKYETPRASRMVLDVPRAVRDRLGNPSVPLFITEGARKADKHLVREHLSVLVS